MKKNLNVNTKTSNNFEMYGVVLSILGGKHTIHLTNDLSVDGYVSGKMRQNNIRVYEKDLVRVSISPYDLYRGRIVYRLNPKYDDLAEELRSLCGRLKLKLPDPVVVEEKK